MLKLFGGGRPDHPLADPKEARRLLDELPEQDPLKALDELTHWHESLAATQGFRPDARFDLLFLLDEAAQPRLRKVARDYLAARRPARFQENRMWTHVYEYYRRSGEGYARAIDQVLQGAKGADAAKPQLALATTRALRAIAQQIKWLHLRYAPVDAAVWRVLNGVFAFAESRGIADAKLPAVYPGAAGESSPKLEYLRALALSVSSPDSLLPPQVEAAERLVADFAPLFSLEAEPGPHQTHWVDLAQGAGPQRLARAPQAGAGVRFLGCGNALKALHAMLQKIETTSTLPEAFGPGAPITDGEGALDLLRHLVLYWSPAAPERKHPRHNVKSRLSIVHGFDGVVAALTGPEGDDTRLDFSSEPAENWIVENVSAGGFGAVVPQARGAPGGDWLKIGALLAMQPDGGNNWLVGVIRRVGKTATNEMRVGIQTLSRAPARVRFAIHGKEETGVLLPAPGLGSGEASIALRAGVFVPGQNLLAQRAGKGYMYMPQAVAERGDDFDIVRFRELVRES